MRHGHRVGCTGLNAPALAVALATSLADALTVSLAPAQSLISSFLDDSETACHQAPLRIAEGALAMKKAAPKGLLYNESKVIKATTCAERGYTFAADADRCYPGVHLFFRESADRDSLTQLEIQGLTVYAARYGLSRDRVNLMSACTCHPSSEEFADMAGGCRDLLSVRASWVHTSPESAAELLCDEGPYEYTTRLLATLKSSPLLPMHQYDQIAPITCKSRGFKTEFPAIDHCYPEVRMWTREPEPQDLGVKESQKIEKGLIMDNGFKAFAGRAGLSTVVLNHFAACNCRADSQVFLMVKSKMGAGVCLPQDSHSPIRDFWEG